MSQDRRQRYLPPLEQDTAPPAQPPRPPLVWFFTLWYLLFAGLQPMGLSVARLFAVGTSAYDVLQVALGLMVLVATYNAWRGKDWGRIAMLWTVTLYYAALIFVNMLVATRSDLVPLAPDGDFVFQQRDAIGRIIRSVLLAGVNIWFCLRADTLRFYRFDTTHKRSAT
jgi:hypothetical protein